MKVGLCLGSLLPILFCSAALAQQPAPQPHPMTFFITSVPIGDGGNLGGLAGADAHCQKLATAAGAGGRTWHAYMSTQPREDKPAINARDRIGQGPWYNFKGEMIAKGQADLHGDTIELARLGNNVTKLSALTEKGEIVPGLNCQVVTIKTKGDQQNETERGALENKRIFTKEIEDSLLSGEIQLAVHSMKDLSTDLPQGLTLAAIPHRADHRDALIARNKRKFEELPAGARVGTSSPRRRTQLRAARSDLQILDIHGNVDTRLRKLDSGACDAIVLAAAGLTRLGLEKRIAEFLSLKIMIPAIGQGALAVEAREDDTETLKLLSNLDDGQTRQAVEAERAFARRLGASCRTPIAAYARSSEGKLAMDGMVSSADGRKLLRSRLVSDNQEPQKVGEELADDLLSKGARLVLEAV